MKYITTRCKNCGYRTRSHESGVPNVQIGPPILRCPKCGHLILDSIQTEYEFMTDNEKAKFSTQSALPKSYLGNILFIVVGLVLLIGGISTGNVAGLICGGGCIALGVYQKVQNQKIASNELIEQAVYESLQRTANSKYVEFIKYAYEVNGIKRNYMPFTNKAAYIEQYKKFELRDSYIQNMKNFNQVLELINDDTPTEQSRTSIFTQH